MFSRTVEYGLRAMVCLASSAPEQLTAEEIADRARLRRGYVSKIMRNLVRAGLVQSQRGPKGGFVLARDPDSIAILDIVNAVDAVVRIDKCPMGNPAHLRLCSLHKRLDDAIADIEQILRTTRLTDVLEPTSPVAPAEIRVIARELAREDATLHS
ncbi:MAG: Rrf2 family transcriptional regulator [Phycisphaerales bacterium]|nr:Rrf2 family transcriptional regulator [Phycisphaerales bacterium]